MASLMLAPLAVSEELKQTHRQNCALCIRLPALLFVLAQNLEIPLQTSKISKSGSLVSSTNEVSGISTILSDLAGKVVQTTLDKVGFV